ncbi:disulfide bond formation protein B [Candidatus Peregrinibacteria bacterium CG10_big_fil_rev_8_21_14_0_10_49_10]|nr:MAG: disulfide bond formation protein B [Candidatus Peregrinibacteria bacterium CG10_big_fil_rev_8_21_14_0_10_49_10]
MEDFIFPIVDFLSVLTLLGDILIALVLLECITHRHTLRSFLSRHAVVCMLVVATIATSGSLFFSEIAGWTPCKDCWFQRIFMYPQVPLLAVALWKRDRGIAKYILVLCIIGAILSADHYMEQIEATFFALPTDPLVPCDASGVSCEKMYTFRFNYISIPMMALTAFVMNAVTSLVVVRRK